MASPIRPSFPQTTAPTVRPAPDSARAAAQRAFFQAALSQATLSQATQTAPAEPVRQAASAPAVRPVQTRVEIPAEAPTDRLPRPGSFLDIKV